MLKFFTSLSFLYAFVIIIMLLYGWYYYRSFAKKRLLPRLFPLVFALICLACIGFLYFNINAPLSAKTISNLDHRFLRHEGFSVSGQIELGKTDTINYKNSSFSKFLLKKENGKLLLRSDYSEEPFFVDYAGKLQLASYKLQAKDHKLSFVDDTLSASVIHTANSFRLHINGQLLAERNMEIKKGINTWNIFRDNEEFINSVYYTDEALINALKSISIIRDADDQLKYFLSADIFQSVQDLKYDEARIAPGALAFTAEIPNGSRISWGFSGNAKNQFIARYAGSDSFELLNRYPVSYPLQEEDRNDWSVHTVNKFLVADPNNLVQMPAVFNEGMLFSQFEADSTMDFRPVLLSFQKNKVNSSLQLQAKYLDGPSIAIHPGGKKMLLPARSTGFNWIFAVHDSFEWKLGGGTYKSGTWQFLIFAVLFFFFIIVFASSLVRPVGKLSWIWQLLSCLTIVLLTTRFFLYWRYKSFPPFEGMDLPSVQQLNSFWNFGIIVLTGLVLAFIFGYHFIVFLFRRSKKMAAYVLNKHYEEPWEEKEIIDEDLMRNRLEKISLVKRLGLRNIYFISWIGILILSGAIAGLSNFDPSVCRHLAIALVLIYFLYVYISYKFSPLVSSAEKKWWDISTSRTTDILVSNPVKVLLSMSLLAVFAFVDIGFAIVFLNFLLFNEAFLCINYAIAGLSAGSKKNAGSFGLFAVVYILLFAVNLLYGPYIFRYLLEMPSIMYMAAYIIFAIALSYVIIRLLFSQTKRKKLLIGFASATGIFIMAVLFFPKERILDKASMTKYRIDVMAMPADKAIEHAYEEGRTYEPVIRAAQNQWFINAFIYDKNNPSVNKTGFNLLPHAPQNKGARYNAQATDLVASRFLIAEHGKWSVLLYVLLLLLPTTLLASFYKLYPDFTNRVNANYPAISTGFSLLNYLLITALLVILAATGRYIFFGQDLPFGSILSKQSILFPAALIVLIVLLFRRIPLEQYPNRKKLLPGTLVFAGLGMLLFFVQPSFNKEKEFRVADLAKDMDNYIQLRLQPLMDHFDTARTTRRLSLAKKDKLFTDSLRTLLQAGYFDDAGRFFYQQINAYVQKGFTAHMDQRRMLYLDIYSGKPQLAVNENYFRVEPPPHLQQYWTGNVFSDTTNYNISYWENGNAGEYRIAGFTDQQTFSLGNEMNFVFRDKLEENMFSKLSLVNGSAENWTIRRRNEQIILKPGDSLLLNNPDELRISAGIKEKVLLVQPDAFMKNYFVNGSRFYVYPMANDFIWARNFSESISSEYTSRGETSSNAFISLDRELMDSLSFAIRTTLVTDTAYKKFAEYGICVADGNGRLIALNDHIKDLQRPDPNDKAGFNRVILGDNGFVSQSLLRKQIGNINLLRMNPGPGSTLKPIVFSAIASQLEMDWDAFAAEGFSEKQQYFGGEKVGEYDFEKNNGRINNVVDYLRHSDNYYHANLLLLGSYSKQNLQALLLKHFATRQPGNSFHWPYFNYNGKQYWLDGFENWPGYINGKANFGSDSSFISVGLFNNYSIYTYPNGKGYDKFKSEYDSSLFRNAYKKSGFILPEYALFDQKGAGMDHGRPNEVFLSSFRGHVKGSSQVMVPPVKMLESFGRLVSQNRNYTLTLNPYAIEKEFSPFHTDEDVNYRNYLHVVREKIFEGMRQALFNGTAGRLGTMLKEGSPYYYYAKTGTTGDNDLKEKSKLFVIIISKKKITDPDFNFRKNKFYTVYFTSQKGPAKQNEEFQARVIKQIERSAAFKKYMNAN